MANHCINPCVGCGADLGERDEVICDLCEADQLAGPGDAQWRDVEPYTDEARERLERNLNKYSP